MRRRRGSGGVSSPAVCRHGGVHVAHAEGRGGNLHELPLLELLELGRQLPRLVPHGPSEPVGVGAASRGQRNPARTSTRARETARTQLILFPLDRAYVGVGRLVRFAFIEAHLAERL